ncbi:CinA family protein [Aeromicrobium terrae]|uniref:CinA family protein n=1 Tax=Aeromicrobium terrae TaxID=2498846 RepID=UPI001C9C5335|nr:CinA family protein [Aeromicrobium terrae]
MSTGVVIDVVEVLRAIDGTVAVAESLTGGLVTARIVDVPGASEVLMGGVVAYAPDAKSNVLGVDQGLIERVGTVHADVAAAMATGVAELMGADWGIATTGNAGPEPSEGKPVGRVHIGVAGPSGVVTEELNLPGGRLEIREQTVDAVLSLLVARLGEESTDDRR